MDKTTTYQTIQREAILSYMMKMEGNHITAAQIDEHFKNKGAPIGITTIYRHLNKLVESGRIRKYVIDGTTGACFQYVNALEECQAHFHLKCEGCGNLIHLQCGFLDEVTSHVLEDHRFRINTSKTVFYGICENCLNQPEKWQQ